MQISTHRIIRLPLIFAAHTLIACSSGGSEPSQPPPASSSSSSSSTTSSTSSSSGATGGEVDRLEWSVFAQPGVWRRHFTFTAVNLPAAAPDQPLSSFWGDAVSLYSLESVSATEVESTECLSRQTTTKTENEFKLIDNHLHLARTDKNGNDQPLCAGEIQERYYVLSQSHFRIDAYCGQERIATEDYQRIRSTNTFDVGEAAIDFDKSPDLAANNDICGGFSTIIVAEHQEGDPAQTLSFQEYMTASAPHGDGYFTITMRALGALTSTEERAFSAGRTFSFSNGFSFGDDSSQGTDTANPSRPVDSGEWQSNGYSPQLPDASDPYLFIELHSAAFTILGAQSDTIRPDNGSLRILQRDEHSVRLQFDFSILEDEHLQGEFVLNFK